MKSQESTTACKEFESLCEINKVLLCKNKVLRLRNEHLTSEKQALQIWMSDLMDGGEEDVSVPEIRETVKTDFQQQITTPDYCESFCQADQVLIQKNSTLCIKNDNMSEEIEALQKHIDELISQKTQVTSSVSEITTATQFNERYMQNHKLRAEVETLGQDTCKLKERERLRLPKMDEKKTQSLSTLEDMENAYKLLLQEKEAWEENKKQLMQEITVLKKERSEIEAKEQQVLKDKEALLEQMDAITKEAKMSRVAWDQEREILEREIVTLKKQKREFEERAKESIRIEEPLQRDVNETSDRAEKTLRTDLDLAEAFHGIDELLQVKLLEEVDALREKVRELEEKLQSQDDSSLKVHSLPSEPDTLSLRHRFMRFFIPGWRRRYSSAETVEYVKPEEQSREEIRRGRTLLQRVVTFYRRTRT